MNLKKDMLNVVDNRSIIKFLGGFDETVNRLKEIMAKEKIISMLTLPCLGQSLVLTPEGAGPSTLGVKTIFF